MDPALKASRSSMLSSASTPEDPDEDAPKAEEVEVYNRLHDHHLGLPVGVHDEAFADPLDGSLRFERIAMHRSLRLECEDESLNFSKAIRELSLEMREGVSGGFGLDVIEAGTSSVARTLVIGSEEERAAVVRAFEWDRVHTRRKMGDRRRGARQRCMSLGCVPCGGGAGRRRRPASAPAGEGHAAGAAAQAPRREVPGMEEAEAYAKELWDAAEPSARPSGTARPSGIGLARARQARSDTRSSSTCAALLWELLAPEGPSGGRGSASSMDPAPRAELFGRAAADIHAVAFEEFWQVVLDLLLVDQLRWDRDPDLRRLFDEGKLHRIPRQNWDLFQVKAQCADKRQVEEEQRRVDGLGPPDVLGAGAEKSLSLLGLAKYFCSQSNSVVDSDSASVSQDMTRPLSEYWIAASHHVYQDPPAQPLAAEAGAAPHGRQEALPEAQPLLRALQAGCRCLCWALAQEGGAVQVLLQRGRAPLRDALGLLGRHAFEENPWPVLLVLHLAALPPPLCAAVAEALEDSLGERLWPGGEPRLPSPQEARGKVVVVLAPDAPSTALAALEQRPGRPAAWRGRAFPAGEAASRQSEAPGGGPDGTATAVGFLPSDGLARLGQARAAWLAEHHCRHLSLVYPRAPRRAPSNFNLAAAWAAGAQLAALALGGPAEGAPLVQAGRFAHENGGCGYVLKPECMRGDSVEAPKALELKLRVLGARALPSCEGPLCASGPVAVAASVWGAPADCSRSVYRFARPSGLRTSWPDAGEVGEDGCPRAMTFVVSKPSAAILCVELAELPAGPAGGPRSLGFFAAPVLRVRRGVRWVPLWRPSCHGEALAARHGPLSGLLVRVDLKELERSRRTRFQSNLG